VGGAGATNGRERLEPRSGEPMAARKLVFVGMGDTRDVYFQSQKTFYISYFGFELLVREWDWYYQCH